MSITLTDDQQFAMESLTAFLADEKAPAFVVEGYAGTGKSTLMEHFLDKLSSIMKFLRVVNPNLPDYQVHLTATTNKAADNLAQITGADVATIHSHLGLRVERDYQTRKTKLVDAGRKILENQLIVVDEAGTMDSPLLTMFFQKLKNCKVIFLGDPAQLLAVGSSFAPVFRSPFPKAKLTKVMRQAEGNPILELATKFRETVTTGEFFSFQPDGHHIQHLDQEAFENAVVAEFSRQDWSYSQSKFLAWTNECAERYNKAISKIATGASEFQLGDYVQNNKFFQGRPKGSIKTDQLVCITAVGELVEKHGVQGHYYGIDHKIRAFCPLRIADKKALLKVAHATKNNELAYELDEEWIDLRAVYAQTINKSQGSTYGKVFIDLNDLRKCNSGETIARLLYVGISRAKHQVILTGDLV